LDGLFGRTYATEKGDNVMNLQSQKFPHGELNKINIRTFRKV
jgi:hypothetical protein